MSPASLSPGLPALPYVFEEPRRQSSARFFALLPRFGGEFREKWGLADPMRLPNQLLASWRATLLFPK